MPIWSQLMISLESISSWSLSEPLHIKVSFLSSKIFRILFFGSCRFSFAQTLSCYTGNKPGVFNKATKFCQYVSFSVSNNLLAVPMATVGVSVPYSFLLLSNTASTVYLRLCNAKLWPYFFAESSSTSSKLSLRHCFQFIPCR